MSAPDAVEQAGLESFPASDAPSSWAGRDLVPANTRNDEDDDALVASLVSGGA